MGYHSDFLFFSSLCMLALGMSLKSPEWGFINGHHCKPNLYEPFFSWFGGTVKLPPVRSCELNCS